MVNKLKLNEIVIDYLNVIKSFKNRYDVQNGYALGYRDNQEPNGNLRIENKPHSIGEGLLTTGYCVSVSQALCIDSCFTTLITEKDAKFKMISIDIKEQFYGECYNGTKNTWHTAVLVEDSGNLFIIDLTCGQFGNRYVNKDVWDFETWERTFRSANCKHEIKDFNGNSLSSYSIPVAGNNQYTKVSDEIRFNLSKFIPLSDGDVEFLVDYFVNKFEIYNAKLLTGMLNKFDLNYIERLNNLLSILDCVEITDKQMFSVYKFNDKKSATAWIKGFVSNAFSVNSYVLMFDSLESACNYSYIQIANIDKDVFDDLSETYVVIQMEKCEGVDVKFMGSGIELLLPYGTVFNTQNEESDIFNGNKFKKSEEISPLKTNTIHVISR